MRLHGKNITAVSIDGSEYRADVDGVIDVPDALAPRLMEHFALRPYASGAPACTPDVPPPPRADGDGEAVNYSTWTTQELLADARRLGIEIPAGTHRKKLIALIKAAGENQ